MKNSTRGFVLAAAVAIVFNTLLACAKDAYAPLNDFMKSVAGHHWTTHGLADLFVFLVLGFLFSMSGAGSGMDARGLQRILITSVVVSAAGLGLWFVLV